MNTRRQERFWNQLISIVSTGKVVPIIGEDLLRLPDSGNLFYEELTARFAEYHSLELGNGDNCSLSSVVRRHPDFRNNPHDIYQSIGEEFEYWNPPIPEVLIQLAQVEHFQLFVSTTFDDLLEKAINQERFNGEKRTIVIPYSPKSVPSDQLVSDALEGGRPVIIQIFGHYKNPLNFALTEGDKVEFMFSLQSIEYSPKRIFNELYERPLLLLGNSFPNWLARLFLRMARRLPLDSRDIPKQYFADAEVNQSNALKNFLQRFTTNTELVNEIEPVNFVAGLAQKWQEKKAKGELDKVSIIQLQDNRKPMPRNSVFISYSASTVNGDPSLDYKAALELQVALEQVNIPVWLDRNQLKGGDRYEREIRRYINTCSVFLPLISENTNQRSGAFFRKEWDWALKRLPEFTGSKRRFIIPMTLGEIDLYSAEIPIEFTEIHCANWDTSNPDLTIIELIRNAYLDSTQQPHKEAS